MAGKSVGTLGKKAVRKQGKKDDDRKDIVQNKIIQYMTRIAQEKKAADVVQDQSPTKARKPQVAQGNTTNLGGRGKTALEKWLQTKPKGTKEGRSKPNQDTEKDTGQGKDSEQEKEKGGVK